MAEHMGRDWVDSSPGVSVVIPTLNGEPEIGKVLESLGRQILDDPVEIIVIDSGSTDGTLDSVSRHPVRVLHVEKDAFDHGDTRNLAVHHARAPFVVILSQDAEPRGNQWLHTLVQPLKEDERVAAVCGRILPRPGMDLLLRRGVEEDLNFSQERRVISTESPESFDALSPYEKRISLNFHDIGSCIRKDLWRRLPLPRTAFGEDLMWARSVLENGYKLVFEPRAEVFHAHEYTKKSIYRRGWWDGWLNRRLLNRFPIERASHVLINTARAVFRDLAYLKGHGQPWWQRILTIPRSLGLQLAVFSGLYRGARRTGYDPAPRVLSPDRPLRVLFVVHGFPPDDLAGTEVYTHSMAVALRGSGHHVAVFHRQAAPDKGDYELESGDFEGLPVYRLTNNFNYNGIEETYENRQAEDRFLEVLGQEKPDVVHFQHCLHTSVSLISLCEDRGISTVVTLNDFWFICPTVQLILPDRKLCTAKKAGLPCVCCARRGGRAVSFGQILVRLLGPLAVLGPAVYSHLVTRFPRIRRDVFEDVLALSKRPRVILEHLRRAGKVVSPSRFLRKQYISFGLDPEHILYQRYGINTGRLQAGSKTPRQGYLRIGFIGSFVWYKGLHVLLEAFRGISPEQAVLTVYGNPELPHEVRTYAGECRRLAEGAPVTFAGPLSQTELDEAHRNMDVLVVPSLWYENSPLVILEARAAGTPVITSDLGGMAEMVVDGITGCLFRRGDAHSLRRCILALVADPSRVEVMAKNIRPPKDIETNLAEIELMYRQEISRCRPVLGLVPFWSESGPHFQKSEGRVEIQGTDLVLLRPEEGAISSISFELEVTRPGSIRFEVITRLLPGEQNVVLSGGLLMNNNWVGKIVPHCVEEGESLVRCHRFLLDGELGTVTLTLTNATDSNKEAAGLLRVQRVAAFHESPEDAAC